MTFLKRTATIFLAIFFCMNFSQAQTLSEPRQEKLLNNLKILLWRDASASKVTVKLRIHSGAAFDPKDKMGTMALLSDILFPNLEDTKTFFTEDLGGSLDVDCNYDDIQISATGAPDKIQTILDAFANAVTNPPITPENFASVRAARLAKVRELEKNPAYVADRAVAKQLFGDFPYGRSADGTDTSLAKIDQPDLLLARDRFLTADNATLAIAGNFDTDAIYQSARRLFGAWEKADKKVPATFRQPDAPSVDLLTIDFPNGEKSVSRSAIVFPARNAKDFYAAQILSKVRQSQFCLNDENIHGLSLYQPHLLRGIYIVSKYVADKEPPLTGRQPCELILSKDGKTVYPPISQTDFDSAKAEIKSDFQQKTQSTSDLIDFWLDVDTYKLVSVKDEMSKLDDVTFADVTRVSEDLQKQPMVRILVKKSEVAKQ